MQIWYLTDTGMARDRAGGRGRKEACLASTCSADLSMGTDETPPLCNVQMQKWQGRTEKQDFLETKKSRGYSADLV